MTAPDDLINRINENLVTYKKSIADFYSAKDSLVESRKSLNDYIQNMTALSDELTSELAEGIPALHKTVDADLSVGNSQDEETNQDEAKTSETAVSDESLVVAKPARKARQKKADPIVEKPVVEELIATIDNKTSETEENILYEEEVNSEPVIDEEPVIEEEKTISAKTSNVEDDPLDKLLDSVGSGGDLWSTDDDDDDIFASEKNKKNDSLFDADDDDEIQF
jgi:hypothetical protein